MAHFEARKGNQLIARTTLAREEQGNNLVYTFEIAQDCIRDSRFSFSNGARR
jgi:hypothetical protein